MGTPIIAVAQAGAPSAEPVVTAPEPEAELEVIDTNVPPEGTPTLVGGPGERLGRPSPRSADVAPPRACRQTESTAHADVQDAFTLVGRGTTGAQELISSLLAEEEGVDRQQADAPAAAHPRALAKPPVRKLAKELGVDLSALAPSGPGGTVTRADVERAATLLVGTSLVEEPAQPASRNQPLTGLADRREPVKGVRKMMAQAMVGSAFSIPHVTEWVTVDVTAAMELVARLRKRPELREVKISPLVLLARAAMLAMRRTPEINSVFDDEAQEIVYRGRVNLGIAAATPRGLVVPNIKDAQSLSLAELAAALQALTDTAREGRTQPAEMSHGTFTITNVGVFGIDSGTPIINPGEAAILAFGAIRKQPWVLTRDGTDSIEVRHVTTLALSFDHRHIDGELGSRFLADVAALMEDPGTALLF
ncbi:MAG: dihydrolipoamide acetyltransferase family protein [Nocardioides sp.]